MHKKNASQWLRCDAIFNNHLLKSRKLLSLSVNVFWKSVSISHTATK